VNADGSPVRSKAIALRAARLRARALRPRTISRMSSTHNKVRARSRSSVTRATLAGLGRASARRRDAVARVFARMAAARAAPPDASHAATRRRNSAPETAPIRSDPSPGRTHHDHEGLGRAADSTGIRGCIYRNAT
jgi:hypothetical protein